MKALLYDLVWAYPLPHPKDGLPVALTSPNTLRQPWTGIPGAILYPALMTPAVIVGDQQPLDLLIAFRKADIDGLTPEMTKLLINFQLKALPKLDPAKSVAEAPLFPGGGEKTFLDFIRFEGPIALSDTTTLESFEKRFRGVLHKTAVDLYKKAGFDTVYRVEVAASCLPTSAAAHPRTTLHLREGDVGFKDGLKESDIPADHTEAIIVAKPAGGPGQDRVVHEAVRPGRFPAHKGKGAYGFVLSGADAIAGRMDFQCPIVAHHPVVVYAPVNGESHLNLGHLSDIHISARQQVLARSPAKLIDQPGIKAVGEMINICSQNTANLLGQLASDPEIDLVIVGGDVVDFINNVILDDPDQAFAKPMDVWDAVKVTAANAGNYHDNVDFLAFHSLLIDAYNRHPKAMFAITGNHDAYYEPYGITPRVSVKQAAEKIKDLVDPKYHGKVDSGVDAAVKVQGTKKSAYEAGANLPGKGYLREDAQNIETDPDKIVVQRANEGIPADHNLTFYEAILAFGDTYSAILTMKNKGRPPSSFWAEKMAWFHQVLTPFSDYSTRLPKQDLVALGWGSNEHMAVDPDADGMYGIFKDAAGKGQGIGHLPRATECINDLQLDLVQKAAAADKSRKLLLTTHFTFVSYDNQIALTQALGEGWGKGYFGRDELGGWQEGDVYYNDAGSANNRTFGKADLGTFHHNRKALYHDLMVGQRRIQLVLTGHSHRRGFYTLRRDSTYGNASVKTGFYDFPTFSRGLPRTIDVDTANIKDPSPHSSGRTARVRGEDQQYPWIVLSDAGGSIPRMNVAAEFQGKSAGGQGSDRPGGTKIVFDKNGEVARLEPVRVPLPRAHPRLAVALDYLDIMGGIDVIESMESDSFLDSDERASTWSAAFEIKLHGNVTDPARCGLTVTAVSLYEGFAGSRSAIPFTGSGTRWKTPPGIGKDLRDLESSTRGKLFIALTCAVTHPRAGVYESSTPWTFEVRFHRNRLKKSFGLIGSYYQIERIKDYAEVPRLADWKRFYASR